MRHHGACFEHEQERNEELIRVYHRVIEEADYVVMPDIYEKVARSPSSRFWVSKERAAIIISNIMRGDTLSGMNPTKKEMYMEIYRRAIDIMKKQPSLTFQEVAFKVVHQPAPSFYLTSGSAKVIICKARKKWYEERKRKLRHLF